MDFDKKNPNHWWRVLLCRTADRVDRTTFKQTIRDVIDSCQDEEGRQVKIRLMGAISDLHAADARYHDDCRKSFMAPCSVAAAAHSGRETQDIEPAVSSTILSMKNDMLRIWNSVEVKICTRIMEESYTLDEPCYPICWIYLALSLWFCLVKVSLV